MIEAKIIPEDFKRFLLLTGKNAHWRIEIDRANFGLHSEILLDFSSPV